ncbi:MAG: hypothetical protein NVSMB6_25630 [Burkholderiaceae bacterium]
MDLELGKGHILLTEMAGAVEAPISLTVYCGEAESLETRGGPINWGPVEPVVVRPQRIALGRNATHPHAALLFADFVVSPEGEAGFTEKHGASHSR